MTSKELREKRANLANQAQALLDKAEEESRDLNQEEMQQFDNIHSEIDNLKSQIDRIERQEQIDADLRHSQGAVAGANAMGGATDQNGLPNNRGGDQGNSQEEEKELRSRAFRNWMVYGMNGLEPELRQVMANQQENLPQEARALAAGLDTAGGYTVFDEFRAQIETAMKLFSGVRNTRANIVRTNSGNDMQMPTSDDTSNKGERLGENTQVSEQDATFGSKTLRAYMYSSKLIRVSIQFLQDTDINNIESWLAERGGERIGRKTGEDFVTGTGNNQPEGLENGTSQGKQGSTQTSIKYDELVDMEHSIDPAYRRQAEWLLADGLLKKLKQLKDGEGRPLWVPGVAVREPDTILGYRYAIDYEIPKPAASKITLYFGDFSKFQIRDVQSMQMLRLTERYADYLQVGFLLFSRHDSILLDAGTNPIKHFKQSS